jgi:hypothetical protein
MPAQANENSKDRNPFEIAKEADEILEKALKMS